MLNGLVSHIEYIFLFNLVNLRHPYGQLESYQTSHTIKFMDQAHKQRDQMDLPIVGSCSIRANSTVNIWSGKLHWPPN